MKSILSGGKVNQDVIDAIERVSTEKASRHADPDFIEMLKIKFEMGNLNPVLIDFVIENSKDVFTKYNENDVHDIEILNNKILFIAEKFNEKYRTDQSIDPVDKRFILNTFRTKH